MTRLTIAHEGVTQMSDAEKNFEVPAYDAEEIETR